MKPKFLLALIVGGALWVFTGRRVEDLIYMQSIYPTTCELAGLEVPKAWSLPV
jgi:hypothetical protein